MLETIFNEKREQAEEAGAKALAAEIFHLVKRQDNVVVGLCGGRSVTGILKKLARKDVPWQKVHFFPVDERLVALEHPDSNFRLLKECLLDQLLREKKINGQQIHPFVFEPKRPDVSLIAFMDSLQDHGGLFDIVVVSSGEDGHIGALFPNHHSVLSDVDFFILMDDSPKKPDGRITSSRNLLLKSKAGFIVFFGEEKRTPLQMFKDEHTPIEECPAKIIKELPKAFVITDLEG